MNDDMKKHFDSPRKMALYMHMSGCLEGEVFAREVDFVDYDERYNRLPNGQVRELPREGCMRISEPVEVSFAATDNEKMVASAVAALDEAERELIRQMNQKIAEIRGRKAKFLAISHQIES